MRVVPDPYLPGHGDLRYAVEHYDLALDYRLTTNRLDAVATLRVVAREATDTLRLDLSGLHVSRVRVGGAKPKKYTHKDRVLTLKLAHPLAAGEPTTVEVAYAGKPGPVPGAHGPAGWEELTDGVLVASQPYGAPSFYPCNDRADDKASYRIAVTTDPEYAVVATGRPTGTSTRAGRTTWVFEEAAPTASYLVSIVIGRLAAEPLPGSGGRVTLHRPRGRAVPPASPLLRLPAMLDALEGWFGPYPLPDFRAVVVDEPLEIPLEAQGMASFGTNHLVDDWDNERLVVHELAHQWFGNKVTSGLLRDIWLHEGFACYAEWLWSPVAGSESTDARARHNWSRLAALPQDLVLAAPGPKDMFDDRVYKRGALTLHALRGEVGDDTFFAILKGFAGRHQHGSVTTADFEALAARVTGRRLTDLFDAWLRSPALPQLGA